MVPVWRSNEELTFIAPAGSRFCPGNRPELILLNLNRQDQPRCLSAEWRPDIRKGVLEDPAPQPAGKADEGTEPTRPQK